MPRNPGSPFDLRPRREPTRLAFTWVFPYAPVPAGRPLPVLRTLVDLPGAGFQEVVLALDTGADLSIVDGGWAALVGFDVRQGAERLEPLRGIGGASVAYIHLVTCVTGPQNDPLSFALQIGFTDPDSPPPPLNVLGRQGFLDAFAIAIENYLVPPRLYVAPRRVHGAPSA